MKSYMDEVDYFGAKEDWKFVTLINAVICSFDICFNRTNIRKVDRIKLSKTPLKLLWIRYNFQISCSLIFYPKAENPTPEVRT